MWMKLNFSRREIGMKRAKSAECEEVNSGSTYSDQAELLKLV